jgi:Tol biopolymer transport system component/tRNA A-37 threonylcarbamoyl transferase component Bud32
LARGGFDAFRSYDEVTSDRWARLEQLYHEALERAPENRAAFLAEACKSDSGLRREVESLLAQSVEDLDRPAWFHAPQPDGSVASDVSNLQPGASLGPYRILACIGAGGMGEVYTACDTRLDRTVAIKVLPKHFRRDAERKQRFDREARIISQFNHPHICTVHDVGEHQGVDYLVMEHLQGATLAERLKKGPLAPSDVLRYAAQIASALSHAHRHGVTHRDLKPANIMLTATGAKLLDFGLAKTSVSDPGTADLTERGVIVGTAQYMAPEQLEGRKADTRTDIFAFGAVVYEMATGRKAFEAESRAALVSAIMRADAPRITELNASLPRALDQIVRTCLAKNPDERWQSMHDVFLHLESIANRANDEPPTQAAPATRWRERLGWVLLVITAVGGALAVPMLRQPNGTRPFRFQVAAPENAVFTENPPAISPDGRKLVFTANKPGEGPHLWLRSLDALQSTLLAGTESAYFPFWAPDSRSVGFFADHKLKRIELATGVVTTISSVYRGVGGTWNQHGVILISLLASGPELPALFRVGESGGEPVPVLAGLKAGKSFPAFLPDGEHFVFLMHDRFQAQGIYAGSLDSSETKFVTPSDAKAVFAPPGYMFFTRGGNLFAQRFDSNARSLSGDSHLITENLAGATNSNVFGAGVLAGVSTNVLAYRTGRAPEYQLAWYDRDGKRLGKAGDPGRYLQMDLSPDAKHVIVERLDTGTKKWSLWMLAMDTGIFSRLTSAGDDHDVVWSSDNREIFFRSERAGTQSIYRLVIGTSEETLLYADGARKVPESWVPGNSILYTSNDGRQFFQLPVSRTTKPALLATDPSLKDEPHVSPDGRLIAYGSPETGRFEVYVATFPGFQNKRQVSKDGGGQPIWRRDGKELFFMADDGTMMAVEVDGAAILRTGAPKQLFSTRVRMNPFIDQYGVTADGRRFLVSEPIEDPPGPITIVVNWLEAISGHTE